jgi:hypothetical protein
VGDVEENVTITVEGAEALGEAADEANRLAEALEKIPGAAAEVSSAAADVDDLTESLENAEAAGEPLGNVLRQDAEAAGSLGSSGGSVDDLAGALDAGTAAGEGLGEALRSDTTAAAGLSAAGAGIGTVAAGLESGTGAAESLGDALRDDASAAAALGESGAAVDDLAGALDLSTSSADSLGGALAGAADGAHELGESGAAVDSLAAGLDAGTSAAESLGTALRGDAAAADDVTSAGAGVGSMAAGLDADAASAAALKDELRGAAAAAAETDAAGVTSFGGGAWSVGPASGSSFTAVNDAYVAGLKERKEAAAGAAEAEQDLARAGESLAGGAYSAGPSVQSTPEEMASSMMERTVPGMAAGMGAYDQQAGISGLAASMDDAAPAAEALGGALGGVASGLGDTEAAAAGSEGALAGVAAAASGAAGNLVGIAGQMGDAFEQLPGGGSPASLMIPGLIALVGSIAPAAMVAGAGIVSFGAMAYPALDKVEKGMSAVSAARTAYSTARGVAQRDPTKDNITAEAAALAKLQAAYASVPADVRPAVAAIHDLSSEFSRASKTSGIQQDAFKDITSGVRDATAAIPSLEAMAKGAAPVISSMFRDIGKNIKSPAGTTFISNITKDMPEVASSVHSLMSSLGGVASALVSPAMAKGSSQFIASMGSLVKGVTPAAMSALKGSMQGLSTVMDAVGTHGGDLTTMVNDFQSLEKVNLGNLSAAGGDISRALGSYGSLFHNSGSTSRLKSAAEQALGQMGIGSDSPVMRFFNSAKKDLASSDSASGMQGAITSWSKSMQKNMTSGNPEGARSLFANAGKGATAAGETAGKQYGAGLRKGTDSASGDAKSAADKAVKSLDGGKDAASKAGDDAGKAYGQDLSRAVKSSSSQVEAAAKDSVAKAMQSAESAARSGSSQVASAFRDMDARSIAALGPLTGGVRAGVSQAMQAARSAAASGMSALASEFRSGVAQAVAAIRPLVSQAQAALAPLPGEFRTIGEEADQGLAAGIRGGEGAAAAAAASVASAVESSMRDALETHSPSRKAQKVGEDTDAGLILGLMGGKAAVQAAMDDVLGTRPFTDSDITSATAKLRTDLKALTESWNPAQALRGSALTQLLDTDNRKLMSLAQQRAKLVSQITAADALAKSVTSAAISGASIIGIAGNTNAGLQIADQAEGAAGTSQNPYTSIQQGLKQQLGQIREFRQDIIRLKKEGLDKEGIQQLLGAGVSGGLPVAQQILGEGASGVKAIAKLQDEIGVASSRLGVTGANAAYENASQIGKALGAGLKDSLKGVDSEMASIAKSLVVSIMTALGDSGSAIKAAVKKIDAELGTGTGTSGGSGGAHVTAPHERYRPPHDDRMRAPVIPQGAGWSSPGDLHADIVINLSGQTLARVSQKFAMQKAKRNPTTYPNLPGR